MSLSGLTDIVVTSGEMEGGRGNLGWGIKRYKLLGVK